ncbi:hypothetical protein SLS60_003571 [Paraconiothyrium brasiliense]|uniref:Cytochrome P450 n=1 Tax=Paraconiothyrium brasiliense TaxID=300254 RepID=A0ABR3RP00_9PLEO
MTLAVRGLLADFQPYSLEGVTLSIGLLLSFVSRLQSSYNAANFVWVALYFVHTFVYNVFFHPLRHIPGPLLARGSGIPYALRVRNGTIVPWVQELHQKYGDAVRLAPSDVSFISGETAWPDIYGFRTGKYRNTGAYLKDRTWFPKPLNGVWSIIQSDEEDHSRMRRNVSQAFSEKALRQQEALLQGYVDLLVHRLGEVGEDSEPVDIMRWYNYTTFDIITDLSFGEPLYCLRDNAYHVWVNLIFKSIRSTSLTAIRKKYVLFDCIDKLKNLFEDTTAPQRARKQFFDMASEKVTKRLEKETDRPDFFSFILKNQDAETKALSRDEMDSNAIIFLIAGSETTATTLSGTTYLLLKHPDKYTKLVHEIRSRFSSLSEITMEEVNKLNYLIACLQEGLRYYPPVPTGFPRVVPRGGNQISGHYIPEGTSVYVSQHATNHSMRNFKDPDVYVPERWLGDEKYVNDNRDAMNPFSFGPRNCLGKKYVLPSPLADIIIGRRFANSHLSSLAYAEMRLILAKVLFKYDLVLSNKTQDWIEEQRVFTLWEKPSLMVHLRPVQR